MAKTTIEKPKRGRPPGPTKKPEELHVRLVTTLAPEVAAWLVSLAKAAGKPEMPAAGLRVLLAKHFPKKGK